MPGFGAIGQFAIGEVGAQAAEFIGPDKYMQPLSEPQRHLPRSPAALAPAFFLDPAISPFVATGWYSPLSEPQRQKPRLIAAANPFFFMQPTPFVSFSWFAGLSEPQRKKIWLLPALQQFFTTDPNVIPTSHIETWYQPLSEPQRHKIWLLTALQQAFAGPAQLRPTPAITAALDAIEQFDTFLGGGTAFDVPNFGEIGVRAIGKPGELGVGTVRAQTGETAVVPPSSPGGSVGGSPVNVSRGSLAVRKV